MCGNYGKLVNSFEEMRYAPEYNWGIFGHKKMEKDIINSGGGNDRIDN